MGVALLAGAGQRHHGACPTRRRLRREGEPGRERPDRPPSRSSGRAPRSPISRWRPRAPRSRRRRTGRAVEQVARAGVLDHRKARCPTTRSTKICSCGSAACIYKGIVDVYRIFVGEMDDETADRIYRGGHRARARRCKCPRRCGLRTRPRSTGTGRSRWPRCTSTMQSANFSIRSPRAGCLGRSCPAAVQRRLDNFNLLITAGFLPQRFRDEMRLEWDEERQRRFDRLMNRHSAWSTTCCRASSGSSRSTVLLKDLDWRIRTGRPLV